jgi:hypothetical protein
MRKWTVFSLLLLAAAASCSHRGEPSGGSQSQEADVTHGSLHGRIVWKGDEIPRSGPQHQPNREESNRKTSLNPEELRINPVSRGVRWVVAWLEAEPDQVEALAAEARRTVVPKEDRIMEIIACTYVPHVVAMREDQRLTIVNRDSMAHSPAWQGDPRFNSASGKIVPDPPTPSFKWHAQPRQAIHISCNIHAKMNAWVWVFDHPFYAVTDDDGRFEISNIPRGTWRLVIHHESRGWLGGPRGKHGQKVTVAPPDATDVGELVLNQE